MIDLFLILILIYISFILEERYIRKVVQEEFKKYECNNNRR